MINSTIVFLDSDEIDVEYIYDHKAPQRTACELTRVANLLSPEKHLRENTIQVIKAQIHHFEREEKANMQLRELTGGI